MAASDGEYSVYLLRCADGSLYTGIAIDVERRFLEHQGGQRGAKYLRGRGPLTLAFTAAIGSRGEAQRVEHQLKGLSKSNKEALVAGDKSLRQLIAAQEQAQASGAGGG